MENNIVKITKKIKSQIEVMINEGRLKEAQDNIAEYEKIIKDDVDIYCMKAIILIIEEKLEEAQKMLREGLAFDIDNFDLNYNLAYVYEQLKQYKQAVKYYGISKNNCCDNSFKEKIEIIINKLVNENSLNINNCSDYGIRKILFIQSIPDIRTIKIAQILHDKGIQTDILYCSTNPKEIYKGLKLPYANIFRVIDINNTINFINNSNYDILFSCNEPDYFSALLTTTNKPLVHDCHDMMSLRSDIFNEQIILEYLANHNSDGNIYVTDLVRKIAVNKFNITNKPIMTLDNYVLKNQLPKVDIDKLSNIDGEIHCVYEGGISNMEGHHRNLEKIFLKLAQNKVHVHYYSSFKNDYYVNLAKQSKYLHCENTEETSKLIFDMKKYDIGLTVLNVTDRNKTFLDTTFPNKAWEYLASGLPILFSDLLSFRQFLKKYNVGEIIDLEGDFRKQVKRVKNIKIENDFLETNKLCMDDYADELVDFLCNVKNKYKLNNNQKLSK